MPSSFVSLPHMVQFLCESERLDESGRQLLNDIGRLGFLINRAISLAITYRDLPIDFDGIGEAYYDASEEMNDLMKSLAEGVSDPELMQKLQSVRGTLQHAAERNDLVAFIRTCEERQASMSRSSGRS